MDGVVREVNARVLGKRLELPNANGGRFETPAPQYQPIDRKKRKGKRVEDYSRDRAA